MTAYNSAGVDLVVADIGDDMAAFDELPARVRERLRNAEVDFSAIEVRDFLARHGPFGLYATLSSAEARERAWFRSEMEAMRWT